jgi:hypothetical protein
MDTSRGSWSWGFRGGRFADVRFSRSKLREDGPGQDQEKRGRGEAQPRFAHRNSERPLHARRKATFLAFPMVVIDVQLLKGVSGVRLCVVLLRNDAGVCCSPATRIRAKHRPAATGRPPGPKAGRHIPGYRTKPIYQAASLMLAPSYNCRLPPPYGVCDTVGGDASFLIFGTTCPISPVYTARLPGALKFRWP